jgi:hypothetical protein
VGLPRRHVRLTSPLAVEEIQRRLAAYTVEWGGDFFGKSVPEPPWESSRFTACQGMASFWFPTALVVTGSVETDAASTVLTAVIRPHGSEIAKLILFACVLLGAGAVRGLLLPSVGLFLVLALAWTCSVWMNIAVKSRTIEGQLAAACDPSQPARARG